MPLHRPPSVLQISSSAHRAGSGSVSQPAEQAQITPKGSQQRPFMHRQHGILPYRKTVREKAGKQVVKPVRVKYVKMKIDAQKAGKPFKAAYREQARQDAEQVSSIVAIPNFTGSPMTLRKPGSSTSRHEKADFSTTATAEIGTPSNRENAWCG